MNANSELAAAVREIRRLHAKRCRAGLGMASTQPAKSVTIAAVNGRRNVFLAKAIRVRR